MFKLHEQQDQATSCEEINSFFYVDLLIVKYLSIQLKLKVSQQQSYRMNIHFDTDIQRWFFVLSMISFVSSSFAMPNCTALWLLCEWLRQCLFQQLVSKQCVSQFMCIKSTAQHTTAEYCEVCTPFFLRCFDWHTQIPQAMKLPTSSTVIANRPNRKPRMNEHSKDNYAVCFYL